MNFETTKNHLVSFTAMLLLLIALITVGDFLTAELVAATARMSGEGIGFILSKGMVAILGLTISFILIPAAFLTVLVPIVGLGLLLRIICKK
jgi:hypothetical protein